MRVIQILPTLLLGDAVSNDALAIEKLLKKQGYDVTTYAENIDARLPRGTAKFIEISTAIQKNDILVYHLSTGTTLNDRVSNYRCKKMMVYHNITPPAFFTPYSERGERLSYWGLQGMALLRKTFDYVLADSSFNRQNLLDAGYTCPMDVCPILIPFEDYNQQSDAVTLEQYNDGRTNILFVGRITPNKKQEDIIRAFACYKQNFDPTARLILIGSDSGMESYKKRLEDYIQDLGVQDVIFPGHISFSEILAFYKSASLFLCLSEHEGFCVPLLEAMHFGVPIVACDVGAVAETLGNGGLLLQDKDPRVVATAMDRVLKDSTLRNFIVEGQKERLSYFSYENVSQLFLEKFQAFAGKAK